MSEATHPININDWRELDAAISNLSQEMRATAKSLEESRVEHEEGELMAFERLHSRMLERLREQGATLTQMHTSLVAMLPRFARMANAPDGGA